MNRKPRIGLVAHGIHDHGGMERAFFELVTRAGDRYDFVVFTTVLAPSARDSVTEWHPIRVPLRPISLKSPLFAATVGVGLTRTRVDLVHTLGALVPNRADLASVHFCHAGHRAATGAFGPRRAPLPRRLNTGLARGFGLAEERWSYRPSRVRQLAAVSGGVARELRRHYPAIPVVVTPNGVDSSRFRPDADARGAVRAEHGVGENDVVLLFVGGDWDHKGVGVAIAAMAESKSDSRLRLWVVGRGDVRRFEAAAERAGIAQRVSFFGVRVDVERFYQAADVFVLPSLYETFSLAVHEAAAAALPVVATAVGGVEDILADGEGGVLVERTPAAVAEAVNMLAGDAELRKRMGEAARSRALALTWEHSVATVTDLYEMLLESRRASHA